MFISTLEVVRSDDDDDGRFPRPSGLRNEPRDTDGAYQSINLMFDLRALDDPKSAIYGASYSILLLASISLGTKDRTSKEMLHLTYLDVSLHLCGWVVM